MKYNSSDKFRMVAKTLFGLEEVLAKELNALGAEHVKIMNRSVEFFGDQKLLYTANLWCRTATRILKPIVSFNVKNDNDLYQKVLKIDWDNFLDVNQTIYIDSLISNSTFDNSLYVAQKTKDAICDHFRNKTGKRPSVDLKHPDIEIILYAPDEVIMERIKKRNREGWGEEDFEYLKKVNALFKQYYEDFKTVRNIHLIDASGTLEENIDKIKDTISSLV